MILNQDQLLSLLSSLNPKIRNKNIICDCPVCGKREFSLSLERNNHPFGCFRKKRCGITGTIYTMYKFLGIQPINNKNVTNTEQINFSLFGEEIKEEKIEPIKLPLGYNQLFYDSYLESRGFDEKDYVYYEVGKTLEYKFKDYVIFPVYQDGKIYGYVGRLSASKERLERLKKLNISLPRYNNSNTKFNYLLYGIDDVPIDIEILILVEGIFSKIALDKKLELITNDNIKCVATFGANITNNQIKKINEINPKKLILMHESDVLPILKKNALKLNNFYNTFVCYLPPNNDPDELNTDEILYSLDNAEKPSEFYFNHINLI